MCLAVCSALERINGPNLADRVYKKYSGFQTMMRFFDAKQPRANFTLKAIFMLEKSVACPCNVGSTSTMISVQNDHLEPASIAGLHPAKASASSRNQFVAELGLYNKSQTAFGMLNGEEIRLGDWSIVVADIECVKTIQVALRIIVADKAPSRTYSLVAIGADANARVERGDISKAEMAIPARARALYLQKSNQIMVVKA